MQNRDNIDEKTRAALDSRNIVRKSRRRPRTLETEMKYGTLAIKSAKDLVFGTAPKPVTTASGLQIGGGRVFPEVNLTVPAGTVLSKDTAGEVAASYAKAAREILQRAVELHAKGLTVEFETLLEMTTNPEIGVEITKAMSDVFEEYRTKYNLPCEIRLTPNDARDFDRPPQMRSGKYLDGMFKLFEEGAKAGGNLLSIESTGGKEICDDALMMCDIKSVVFALGVLGVRDMQFLWGRIADIARRTGKLAGGDTACGFANTAMVLAERNYIPRVFAAAVRVASVPRSLVAIEQGATGPHKDCGYEGVFVKAISGIPIAMEGKTAACAHMSQVGNVAAACADLWSNESVQNIKLLGGMAPTVYFEQLEYDCRLFNGAGAEGRKEALNLQRLLVESDIHYDPQAFVLAPANVISISKEIVKGRSHLESTKLGVLKAMDLVEEAVKSGLLSVQERELDWIARIRDEVGEIPSDESAFIDQMLPLLDATKFVPAEYGL